MDFALVRLIAGLVLAIAAIIALSRWLNLHAFFGLLIAAILLGTITGLPFANILLSMQAGFGLLLQQIGFVVALGACLGVMLEKTGAMAVISNTIVRYTGKRNSILGMSMLGLLVGIPVFCDSGFIILSRLIPEISLKTGASGPALSMALSSGLYTTHSLVPPTPGPLAAAANLGLGENLGLVIITGLIVSLPVGLAGFVFARRRGQSIMFNIESRPSASEYKFHSPVWAFLPLVIPIVLIAVSTIPKVLGWTGKLSQFIQIVGSPFVSLIFGLLLAIPLIPRNSKQEWPGWISSAIADAGVILLITGAGGAFGSVIRESGVETILKGHMAAAKSQTALFMLTAFAIAAILKTAQGSTTSSMIITTSLVAPLMINAGFEEPFQVSLLVTCIGCGAMCLSHANDSYFWVVSQFGGISPRDSFKSFSIMTAIQSFVGLISCLLLLLLTLL